MPPLFLVAALVLGLPTSALAQGTKGSPAPAAVTPAAVLPITTLEQALEHVRWGRGAILVVNPQHTGLGVPDGGLSSTPSEQRPPPKPLLLPRPGRPFRLTEVAPFFGRKVVRLETLTLLAPAEMVVLNPRPDLPAFPAGLPRRERLRCLLATLSPAQWQKIGGTAGLGAGDLSSAEQRALFLSILPDPLPITRQSKDPGAPWGVRREKLPPLAPDGRAQVCLRVKLATSLWIPRAQDPGNPNGAAVIDSFFRVPEEGSSLYYQDAAEDPSRDRRGAQPWGVPVRQAVSNRLKPGHLAFGAPALSIAVPLTGTATVGDLVSRVGQAAGLELYADLRVARLPVWTRGEAARAGDVLRALCYAVTGTFRRVGPAFVLTDDLLGVGARGVLLRDWARDAQALEESWGEVLTGRIRAQQPLAYLGFSAGDPYAPGLALMHRLENYWAAGHRNAAKIAVSDLPPALGAVVRQTMTEQTNPQLVQDHVRLDAHVRLAYVVPGLGEVEHGLLSVDAVRNLLPRAVPEERSPAPGAAVLTLPSLPMRALLVRPSTGQEAAQAARAARLRGFTHLWVEVSETSGTERLRAALAAGKAEGVPVVAAVRLLRRAESDAGDKVAGDPEINALGEALPAYARRRLEAVSVQRDEEAKARLSSPQDWLRADDAATAARLKRWLTQLSSLPGLAGLALQDSAAPGCAEPDRWWTLQDVPNSWEGGYGEAMRLSFLRQTGVDPIDLPVPQDDRIDLRLPFFPAEVFWPRIRREGNRIVTEPGGESPLPRWNRLRFETNARLLMGLFAAIRSARPDLPVWVQSRSFWASPLCWFRRWDGAEATLPRQGYAPKASQVAQMAQSQGGHNLFGFSWPSGGRDGVLPDLQAAAGAIKPQKGWQGMVLDLSALPAERSLPLLESIALPRAAPVGASTGK